MRTSYTNAISRCVFNPLHPTEFPIDIGPKPLHPNLMIIFASAIRGTHPHL
jgi:hypothetical protein